VIGRAWELLGGLSAQRAHVLEEGLREWSRVLGDGDTSVLGLVEDPVVDVGQVHHMGEPETGHLKVPAQQVVEEEREQVAYVRVVPYGRPACVHADLARFLWLEDVLRTGQRVVQP